MEKRFLDEAGLRHLVATKIKPELDKKVSLDENGMIPSSKLPSYVDDVVEFDGFVDDGIIVPLSLGAGTVYIVVYIRAKKRFAAQIGLTQEKNYYSNWGTRENYQELNANPHSGKIFVDRNTNKTYRWSGSDLVEVSESISLGETSSTAYAGDKGAKNAKDIKVIMDGDLPLVGLTIGRKSVSESGGTSSPWTVKTADGKVVLNTSSGTGNLNTLYGYTVTFSGSYMWKKTDGYKDPTATNGGNWAAKALPASGVWSDEITIDNITEDADITAIVKAPKQGLILVDGCIKASDGTAMDSRSATLKVHFDYKVVMGAVDAKLTVSSLQGKLNALAQGGDYYKQSGRAKVVTGVSTTASQYYVYAYPSKLGKLSKIVMNDATPLLDGGFTFQTLTVKDPETGKQIEYNVYTSEQQGAFTNAKLDFA